MILVWMLIVLTAGGLLAWGLAWWSVLVSRWTALVTMIVFLVLGLSLWSRAAPADIAHPGPWVAAVEGPWIPQIGARFMLMADGITMLLLLLVGVVGVLAVAASWRSLTERVGLFHFTLLLSMATLSGVFMAMDLLLFYLLWELMLIPLFLLILIWGRENRRHAAIKFFLYTQAGGLLLLVGILALYFAHYADTGALTFSYFDLLDQHLSPVAEMLIMLAFLAAFAIKLPVVPVHGWLPDAHAQAPVAGSVDLAGLVLKAGAYAVIRFLIPLLPHATAQATSAIMTLAVVSILYGAILSFGQTDLKRLIAYTSVSHMGFVLLGVYSWNELALQGTMVVILAHGVSTAGLFVLAGMLHERTGTYELDDFGGLARGIPALGGMAMVLAMASLGLPGLANFVGEFLILLGTWRVHPVFAALAAGGLIVSVVYSLKIIQSVFHGPELHPDDAVIEPVRPREAAILGCCIAILLWIGIYPAPVLRTSAPAMENLQKRKPSMSVSMDAPALGSMPPNALPFGSRLNGQDSNGGDAP